MTLESKNCKDCRPKRKPPAKLSAKEIHNRVQSGDMNNFVADKLREKRQRDAHNKQGMASRNRWYSEWKAELKDALMPITREIVSARSAWTYAREKGYIDKAEFYFEYMGMLKHEKTHAEMSYMLTPRRPVSARWADYIGDAVFSRVRDMWAALPPVYKHSRIPLLIAYRDAFTQVNKDGKFVPPRSLAYLKGEK
jgi:hypothetical protein